MDAYKQFTVRYRGIFLNCLNTTLLLLLAMEQVINMALFTARMISFMRGERLTWKIRS